MDKTVTQKGCLPKMRSRAICVVAEGGTCGWGVWVRRVYVVCMEGRANINWSHVIARTQVIYAAAGGSPLQLMLVFPTTSAKELTWPTSHILVPLKGCWWCLFIWFWSRSWDLTNVHFLSSWLVRPPKGKDAEMLFINLYHLMNQFDILKIFLGFGMSIWRSTHVIYILPPFADATKNGISDQMMLECGMILDVTPNTVQPVHWDWTVFSLTFVPVFN